MSGVTHARLAATEEAAIWSGDTRAAWETATSWLPEPVHVMRRTTMSSLRKRRLRSILDRDTPSAEKIVLRSPTRAYQTDNASRTDPHVTNHTPRSKRAVTKLRSQPFHAHLTKNQPISVVPHFLSSKQGELLVDGVTLEN